MYVLRVQCASPKLMMSGITSAEDRRLVAKSCVEPRVLERFGVSIEEDIKEWRVVDMELIWCYAYNWTCVKSDECLKRLLRNWRSLPYVLWSSFMCSLNCPLSTTS